MFSDTLKITCQFFGNYSLRSPVIIVCVRQQQKNFPSSANEAVVTASLLEHNSPVMALSLFGYNLEITHCSAPAQEDHVNLQGVPPIDLSHYVAG